ncbi:MAG: glycosyl hydrolase family 18 protein [Clostridia bacterium]
MKKFKFVLAIALIAIVMTSCLVGCNSGAMKDVPIDTTGMYPEENLAYKKPVTTSNNGNGKALVDGNIKTVWKTHDLHYHTAEIDFGKEIDFNTVVLREESDAVNKFRLYAFEGDKWKMIYEQDRIMRLRTCYIEPTKASKLKIMIVENRGDVKISSLEVYNQAKRDKKFMVTDYCTMDYNKETGINEIVAKKDDPGFTGYFNVITDIIAFNCVSIDNDCNIIFNNGEENFAKSLDALKYIIKNSGRQINIWCTIMFNPIKAVEGMDFHDTVANMLRTNSEKWNANVKAFVEKYALYGIDYDWEYPHKQPQWDMYDKLVIETAKFTKVSVALPPWGIYFSKDAIKAINHVNLMTYDLFDDRGDHCNMFIGGYASAYRTIKAGFKKEQIMLGIPTYGRVANKTGSAWPVYNDKLGKWGNIVRDYDYGEEQPDKTVERFTSDGFVNGFAMTRDKTLTAIDMDLGGIMIFRAKCDTPYTYEYSLHKAMKEVIDNRIGK